MKEKAITFRLKCDPRISVTAPTVSVHQVEGGYGIIFWNENDCMQTIVMPDNIWIKEEKK